MVEGSAAECIFCRIVAGTIPAARVVRTTPIIWMMPTATTSTGTDCPKPVTKMATKRMVGTASFISTRRMTTSSKLPRCQAVARPSKVPPSTAKAPAAKATSMATRPPQSNREKASRPRSSVPSQ